MTDIPSSSSPQSDIPGQPSSPQTSQHPDTERGFTADEPPFISPSGRRPAPFFRKFSMFKLLVSLFISPRLALLNVRIFRMWFRTLAIILLTSCVAAVLKSCQENPAMQARCRMISGLCADTLGTVSCSPGVAGDQTYRFDWGSAELGLPAHASCDDWRIDVVDSLEGLEKAAVAASHESGGMVIAHDGLTFWLRGHGDDSSSIYYLESIPMRMFADVFRQYGHPKEGAFELSRQELLDIGDLSASVIAILSGAQLLFDGLQMVFTCLVIFIVMSLVFQRGVRVPFSAHVASAFACVIPPFLLANIGELIPAVPVGLDTLFTVFFLIYLVVIYVDRSVVIKARSDQ